MSGIVTRFHVADRMVDHECFTQIKAEVRD